MNVKDEAGKRSWREALLAESGRPDHGWEVPLAAIEAIEADARNAAEQRAEALEDALDVLIEVAEAFIDPANQYTESRQRGLEHGIRQARLALLRDKAVSR